jgi:hypothetical protein
MDTSDAESSPEIVSRKYPEQDLSPAEQDDLAREAFPDLADSWVPYSEDPADIEDKPVFQ